MNLRYKIYRTFNEKAPYNLPFGYRLSLFFTYKVTYKKYNPNRYNKNIL